MHQRVMNQLLLFQVDLASGIAFEEAAYAQVIQYSSTAVQNIEMNVSYGRFGRLSFDSGYLALKSLGSSYFGVKILKRV